MLSGHCLAPISGPDSDILFPQPRVECASDDDCPVEGSRCRLETRGFVRPESINFDPDNWNKPVTVTVFAYNDDVSEGLHYATITHEPASQTVSVEISDDDAASLIVDAEMGTFRLLEGDLTWHYFTVALSSEPHHDVRMMMHFEGIGSSNVVASFADPAKTFHVFTRENYKDPVPVTLYAKDDDVAMGGTYSVGIVLSLYSSDKTFDRVTVRQEVLVDDNDQAGLYTLCPGRNSRVDCPPPMVLRLREGEKAGETVFALSSRPLDDVLVSLSEDTGYCSMVVQAQSSKQSYVAPNFNVPCRQDSDCRDVCLQDLALMLGQSTVSFTRYTWDMPQTVSTYARDDVVVEVDPHRAAVHYASSSVDPEYNASGTIAVVEIMDNDVGGVMLSTNAIVVAEGGDGVAYKVSLRSAPHLDVTVTIGNTPQLQVFPDILVFNGDNWDKGQLVEVIAVDDDVEDSIQHSTVDLLHVVTSDDPAFEKHADVALRVNIVDNNAVGIVLSRDLIQLKEGE